MNDEIEVAVKSKEMPPSPMEINDIDDYSSPYKYWSISDNAFYPVVDVIKSIPAGYYEMAWDNRRDMVYFKRTKIMLEELVKIPDDNYDLVLRDIRTFWESKDEYMKRGFVYKRGILLYGKQGTGKSSMINMMAAELMSKHNGIVINIPHPDMMFHFHEAISILKRIEGERFFIFLMEDIDNYFNYDQNVVSILLNILDGNMQVDNMVTLATTNYPEKLEERISHRPSRFDLRVEMEEPREDARRVFLDNKLTDEDKKKFDIDQLVKLSEGYTIDYLKELVLMITILGYEMSNAIDMLNESMKSGKIFNKAKKRNATGFKTN